MKKRDQSREGFGLEKGAETIQSVAQSEGARKLGTRKKKEEAALLTKCRIKPHLHKKRANFRGMLLQKL